MNDPLPHKLRVATVLTVYGIETIQLKYLQPGNSGVATVLTVYGIETMDDLLHL